MTYSRHFLKLAAVDGAAGTPLAPLSGTLTLNERRSPFCEASFEIALPLQETIDDLLDPRAGQISGVARVEYAEPVIASEVTALAGGVTVTASDVTADLGAGGALSVITGPLHTPWNADTNDASEIAFRLRIDSARPDYEAGTMRIEASSFETRLQDYRYLNSSGFLIAGGQSLRWIVDAVIGAVSSTYNLDPVGPDMIIQEQIVWEFGVSAWDFLDPLLQTAGLTLQCTAAGEWRVLEANANPAITVEIDRPTSLEPISNRDEWATAVMVRWKWRDGAGIEQVSTDYAATAGSTVHKMLIVEHTDTPYPGPGAALRILARASRQGRDVNAAAVSRYNTEPGQQLEVNPPGLTPEEGRVTAITFQWPANTMRITTQESAA